MLTVWYENSKYVVKFQGREIAKFDDAVAALAFAKDNAHTARAVYRDMVVDWCIFFGIAILTWITVYVSF